MTLVWKQNFINIYICQEWLQKEGYFTHYIINEHIKGNLKIKHHRWWWWQRWH